MTATLLVDVPVGRWEPKTEATAISVLSGLMLRDISLNATVASELLGPGDLVCRGDGDGTRVSSPRLTVVAPARVALIDVRRATLLGAWPRMSLRLIEQVTEQLERSSELAAIGHLPRVEDRVLHFMWHVAERHGHVTREGVVVPVYLTHTMLGQLVGARRPTISIALRELESAGLLTRPDEATWLLAHDAPAPDDASAGRASRAAVAIATRRRTILAPRERPVPT